MAAALVGGAFLSATLQVLFETASREFLNLFQTRNHDDKLLWRLKLKLLGLNKVLNDAEDKQISDQAVNDWLEELKHAVYHTDDLVDQIATEALRCKVEAEYHNGPNQVRPPISSLFDAEIESKLAEIIGTLDDLAKVKDDLGLRDGVGQNWSHTLPTTSLVDESSVFGRETDKEEIMKLLISGAERSNEIDVIPIVGMGGVGKTTLAQLLFNDGRVDKHFGMKAWVCVSDVFDVLRVTRTIVEAVTGKSCDGKDLNSLQVKLKESLSRRRFLIVLDDVWNENYHHWDVLKTPFRFGSHGSRIIVTTRNHSVASIVKTVPVSYCLQELEAEDCWKLFSSHAFGNGDSNAHPNLEPIGRQIVEKCKGLPLVAKTLGGLLCSTREVEDWNTILKSSIWDLPKEKSNILPALRLSYHYLPSHLKRCFAYCSTYPKDYEFDVKELVQIWIAEGFVERPKSSSKTVEEQGYECFRELLSRSFFQRHRAGIFCFVMHDLVHDLAQSIAGHFCYRLEDDKPHNISEKLHHLSYVQCTFDGFERLKVVEEAKFLRTFLPLPREETLDQRWLSKKVLAEILTRLTRLRLLSLSRYEIMELPHSIGNLIHLRFLDLSYTRINQLPDSVCSLYNLETLLLSHCRRLETLPADIGKLISLRHLDLSETNLKEMPMQINRLKDLQELTAFVVGKCSGSGISELKEFHHLCGTISISGLQNVTSAGDALEAKMREKKHLEKLVLEWGVSTNDSENERDVLDKLQPHTNLKHLGIKNYGGTRFPDWLGDQSFCKMVSLRLENCEYCFSLPPLGQLPSLKELTIARMKGITNVGDEFYGESGSLSGAFQSLETLHFEEMSEWVEWLILDGVEFSRLQNLKVIECPKLIGGLPKHIPSLERLEIYECPELVASLPRTTSIRELELNNCSGMELGWQCLSSVETLTISGFVGLKELTSELFSLTNLKNLKVEKCPSLVSFPHTGLPPMLTELSIGDCKAMQHFSEGIMRLNNLKRLYVGECPELVFPLHEEMRQCYRNLEGLDLCGCHGLKSLPLGFFPKLRRLWMWYCENFETLSIPNGGPGFQNLTFLETVDINGCENMVSFPTGGLPSPNLFRLSISKCKKLKALPEQMHTLLPSLQSLYLDDCLEIESFPEGGLPSKLRLLVISDCMTLVGRRRDWGLQTLPSLKHFTLECKSGGDLVESFPEEGLLPSSLTSLQIHYLPNLKSLNKRGLRRLGSLKYMRIEYCDQLQSLPEDDEGGGIPTSLVLLEILRCRLLKPRSRSREEGGEDWHKIAGVPFLNLDGEAFFDQDSVGPLVDGHFIHLYYDW